MTILKVVIIVLCTIFALAMAGCAIYYAHKYHVGLNPNGSNFNATECKGLKRIIAASAILCLLAASGAISANAFMPGNATEESGDVTPSDGTKGIIDTAKDIVKAKSDSENDKPSDAKDPTIEDLAIPKVEFNEDDMKARWPHTEDDMWLAHGSTPAAAQAKVIMSAYDYTTGEWIEGNQLSGAVDTPMWCPDLEMGYARDENNTESPYKVTDFSGSNLTVDATNAVHDKCKVWLKQFKDDLEGLAHATDRQLYMREVVYEHNPINPIVQYMWLHMLSKQKVATKNNPWIAEAKAIYDKAYKSEDGLTMTDENGKPIFLEHPKGYETRPDRINYIKVTEWVYETGCKINALLDYFVGDSEIQKCNLSKGYWLPMQSDFEHMKVEVRKDLQTNRDAFVLHYRSNLDEDVLTIYILIDDLSIRVEKGKVLKAAEKAENPKTGTPNKPGDPDDPGDPNKEYGPLTIHYVKKLAGGGEDEFNTHHSSVEVGQEFNVPSPDAPKGYTCRTKRVKGKMESTSGYETTVYYDPDSPVEEKYDLRIQYVKRDGGTTQKDHYEPQAYKENQHYRVPSPSYDGYECELPVVEGDMPKGGKTVIVYYHKKDGEGGKTPTEDPADNGNGDNGGGDNKPNDNDGKPQTNEPDNGGSGGSSDNNAPSSGGNSNPSDADKKKQEEDAADKNGGQTSGGDSPQKPNKDNASENTTGGGTGTTDNDNGDDEIVDEF